MDEDQDILIAAAAAQLVCSVLLEASSESDTDDVQCVSKSRSRRRKKRSCYAREWIMRRAEFGQYSTLLRELSEEDPPSFQNFTIVHLRLDFLCNE